MALIERLMNLAPNGVDKAPYEHEDPTQSRIAVHEFFAAQQEVVAGYLTAQQVKTFLNMDAETAAEYDALIAKYPTGTTAAAYFNKTTFISRVHGVFILASNRRPGYDTPANVRAKLGL